MSTMSIISVACGMMIGSSSQTRLPDCTRKCCGRLNMVNMSIGISPGSLSRYREMQARDVDQESLDCLLDQTVESMEKELTSSREQMTLLGIVAALEKENAANAKEKTARVETQLCQLAGGTPAARTLHPP